jgi:hypothetical protein
MGGLVTRRSNHLILSHLLDRFASHMIMKKKKKPPIEIPATHPTKHHPIVLYFAISCSNTKITHA